MSDPVASPDPLRPTAASAASAWAQRVQAGQAQVARLREVEEPGDFYGPMAVRFAQDPQRTNDAALDQLLALTQPAATWLDIGAGGGRYSLPVALRVRRVHAVEPSPSMLEVLRQGMVEHGISNIEVHAGYWPMADVVRADVALMAHVGYDIETFGGFLDAAERAADRCVVVMRTGTEARPSHMLWTAIHGETRLGYPMLQELVVLLFARGVVPEVTLVPRGSWGYASREQLLASARQLLWLRPGSEKDRQLTRLVEARASERGGKWELDWSPMQDGIVTWASPR